MIHAVRSKPSIGGAARICFPMRATKLSTIGSTPIPAFSFSRISARMGVAEPQFCMPHLVICSRQPHWQVSFSATSLYCFSISCASGPGRDGTVASRADSRIRILAFMLDDDSRLRGELSLLYVQAFFNGGGFSQSEPRRGNGALAVWQQGNESSQDHND